MIYNNLYHTFPSLLHSPGRIKYSPWWNVLSKLKTSAVTKPKNLSIVTCNSGVAARFLTTNGYELGTFENSLNDLPHYVLGSGCKDWSNVKKIDLLIDFLYSIDTKYTLYADSSDAILLGDPAFILDNFKKMHCKMLFNAEKNFWPPEMEAIKKFEESKSKPPFQYLNAGVWIGETDFCREVFSTAKLQPAGSRPNSEQVRIKPLYPIFYPLIKIDDTCQVFQNLNRGGSEISLHISML